ncbi:VOC family protein [Chitinivorax sp. B]|uniref:VOC family protein n=1 Tax=Chitinivorax sp. B TaxID=2502235 RepID=UPI0010F9D5A3|nr:VOC family protein [Chitinivorax sp. B]
MSTPHTIEIKAFIPARDFTQSLAFYRALGFNVASIQDDVAFLHHSQCSFLLQDYYVEACAHNLMMHLLVDDVDAWHTHVLRSGGVQPPVRLTPVELRPWGMRDFVLIDPSGVLWRIAENVPTHHSHHTLPSYA